MKTLFKNKLVFTRNRQIILLNFSLIWVATILSGLAFDSLFGSFMVAAFMGGVLGSIVLRIIFAKGNARKFEKEHGNDATVTASNGLIFKRKHKRIVVSVMVFSAVAGWWISVSIKSPLYSDVLPSILNLFIFQLFTKTTIFFLDLPIGTFNEDQNRVQYFNNGCFKRIVSISPGFYPPDFQEIYTSTLYKNNPANLHYDRNKWL